MLKTTRLDYLFQNGLGIIILAITVLLCWPLIPKPNPEASGILLPAHRLPTTPASVEQLQILQTMPPKAQVLGTISTQRYYKTLNDVEEQKAMTKSLDLVRKLAAQAGANAVIINAVQSGFTVGQGPLNHIQIQAQAIYY